MTLARKIALITGGSKGIGLAIARALAREGAAVAIAARNQADLDAALMDLRAKGARAEAVVCDVADSGQVERLAPAVQDKLGPVDILINNAGIAGSHKLVGHPDDLWARILHVNLTGTYYVCKALAPGMIERRWGRIINIASVASKVGARYMAAYTASKHGVLGLTRALAAELIPYNVTVNAICPGYVDTPMTATTIANIMQLTGRSEADARKAIEGMSPQNRLIEPEEVAAVAVMLAQDTAKGITGQAINVDGGAVMF
jgi:NAD(P)-dependent dehydrogenase (short-subunit alcohol dehydrogenase family)